jgi:hypothetical protein
MGMNSLCSNSRKKLVSSPEKSVLLNSTGSSCMPSVPQMGLHVGSPHRGDSSPKTGSILHKAALFESSPTKRNGKDPAELPIAERMALFERNKGQVLIPKAAVSMPIPAKYLAGSNDGGKNVPNKVSSPGKGSRMVDIVVTRLQESMTSDNKPQKLMSPGKGIICTEVAPPPPVSTEGMNIMLQNNI